MGRTPGRGQRVPDDAGFSMAEVIVTMSVMSVVMLLFTGAIMQVYKSTRATDSLTVAQSQLATAFQRFDRELRYASWISQEGSPDGGTTWYVEFAGPDPTQCRQLRLQTTALPAKGSDGRGILQLLQWQQGAPPAPGTPGQTIASNVVTTPGRTDYFKRWLPGETQYATPSPSASASLTGTDFTSDFQRLRLQLTTQSSTGSAQIDVTFTALNTSRETQATNPCSEGRPLT